MFSSPPPGVHDLIRLDSAVSGSRLEGHGERQAMPGWACERLRAVPWVVVRRAGVSEEGSVNPKLAVGVRGPERWQRLALDIPLSGVAAVIRPEDLLSRIGGIARTRVESVPALAALPAVASIMTRTGFAWGPGGSVGFELATDTVTARRDSDLDIVVRAPRPLERAQAAELHSALSALPVRVDTQLETILGAVVLEEFACGPSAMLLRTPAGPRLVSDPWDAGELGR
ncbi:malonate decarboxylase holo-ACP synthase [Rhodococcus daqingensis]|uniref:Malonate decarboxylase holo-ACP synthase n=1 Tax=Rhodococcus daqingensis TaxID=2479363 RepID=A0ABW2RW07_9NOCA